MPRWLNRVTVQTVDRASPATMLFIYGSLVDWIENPDVSNVVGVPVKYWKMSGDIPFEMTQAEKDAVDAAEVLAALLADRVEAIARTDVDITTRELVEVLLFEINKINTRIEEYKDVFEAIKATSGGSDNIRAAILDTFLNISPKTRGQVLQKMVDDINAGTADP